MYSEILHAFDSTSAPFMYAITLLLAYALTIIVERCYHYYFCWPQLLPFLENTESTTNKPKEENFSKHPIHPLIQATSSQMSYEYWKQVSKHTCISEIVVKNVCLLANIANIATMLGLLGTVYGLVYALGGLDEACNKENSTFVRRISAAMTQRLGAGCRCSSIVGTWISFEQSHEIL